MGTLLMVLACGLMFAAFAIGGSAGLGATIAAHVMNLSGFLMRLVADLTRQRVKGMFLTSFLLLELALVVSGPVVRASGY